MADIVPIYVHSAPNHPGMKYFYDQNLKNDYGWGEGTVAFKAYAVPWPGTIPIYVHTAGTDNPRYYYDGSEQNDFGWSVGSVSFYAYASEQPGTIPIYCHSAGSTDLRYYYDTLKENAYGWSEGSIYFWAYPAAAAKSKIVVVSDVHIGIDARTNWYQSSVHEPYLAAILNWVIDNAAQIRELVLLGDIVDFWTYPSDTRPPDVAAIVAAQPALFGPSGLFGKVAAALPGAVHYLVGNHDIGITAADVAKLTPPNAPILFEPGTTVRKPLGNDAVVVTHGSEYVLFNAQDHAPRNPHAPLPLGHFITRSAATYFMKKKLQPGQTVADLPNVGTPLNAGFFSGFGGLVGSLSDPTNGADVSTAEIMLDYVIGTMQLTPADVSPFTLPGGAVETLDEVHRAYDSLFAEWVARKGFLGAVAAVENDLNEQLDDYAVEEAASTGASVVVMGHTHTAVNKVFSTDYGPSAYVNSGFECASKPDLSQKPPTFAVVDVGDTSITTSIYGASMGAGNQISISKLLPDCNVPYAPGRKRGWSPKSLLADLVDVAGFTYDPKQDIILSKMDPLQRKFGYAYGYDAVAPLMSAVIDCEPIFFDFNNKHWMIELWKGQYGLETGCEIGVYTRDPGSSGYYALLDATLGQRAQDSNPTHNLFYDCASDSDRLEMSSTLYKNGQKLFTRGPEKHWWLTGFKWGVLSRPQDLTMDVSINFGNTQMCSAFVTAATALGYQHIAISGTTASFTFATPYAPQPRNEPKAAPAVAAANAANAAIVSTYNALKLPSNDPNTVPDDMANRLATYVLMYSATSFGQAFAAAFEALKTLLKKAVEAVNVLTDFFGMKADTAASLVTFDKCDFASTCGENSSATSGSGLLPFGRVQINNSTDLSGCIKANDGGCVYGISLRRSEGIYQYTVTVDAQGPSGILSGSMYLRFTDQTGDVYLLTIFSSDRKTHTVSYNSDKPAITKIEWSNWLF